MTLPLLPLATIFTSLVCNKFAIPNQPSYFKIAFPGGAFTFDCCPFGYIFVQKACRCVRRNYVSTYKPRLHKEGKVYPSDLGTKLDWNVEVFPSEFVAEPANIGGEAISTDNTQFETGGILQDSEKEFPAATFDTNLGDSVNSLHIGDGTNLEGSPVHNILPNDIGSVSSTVERNPLETIEENKSSISNSSSHVKPRQILGFGSFVPFYVLRYRYRNGRIVKMPVIYRYFRTLPRGSHRVVRLKRREGFLVPFPIFIMAANGRFVFNPKVVRLYPQMLRSSAVLRRELVRLNSEQNKKNSNTGNSPPRPLSNTRRRDSRNSRNSRMFSATIRRTQNPNRSRNRGSAATGMPVTGTVNPRPIGSSFQNTAMRFNTNKRRLTQDPIRRRSRLTRIQFPNGKRQTKPVQNRKINNLSGSTSSGVAIDNNIHLIAQNNRTKSVFRQQHTGNNRQFAVHAHHRQQRTRDPSHISTRHRNNDVSKQISPTDSAQTLEPSFTQLGINPNESRSPLFLFGLNGVPISSKSNFVSNSNGVPTSNIPNFVSNSDGIPGSSNPNIISNSNNINGVPTSSNPFEVSISNDMTGVPTSSNHNGITNSNDINGVPASSNSNGITNSNAITGASTSSNHNVGSISNNKNSVSISNEQAMNALENNRLIPHVQGINSGSTAQANAESLHPTQSVLGIANTIHDNTDFLSLQSGLNGPLGKAIDPSSDPFLFEEQDLGLFLDPTTGLPPGFTINHGAVNQGPYRVKGFTNPHNQPGIDSVSNSVQTDSTSGSTGNGNSTLNTNGLTPFSFLSSINGGAEPGTAAKNVPGTLIDLLHDQLLLQNLNSILNDGASIESLNKQSSTNLPLVILETLTRKEVMDYLKWLLLYTQGLTTEIGPNNGEIPKALLDMLKHPDFINYMRIRRGETNIAENPKADNTMDNRQTKPNAGNPLGGISMVTTVQTTTPMFIDINPSDANIGFRVDTDNTNLGPLGETTPPLREWLSVETQVKPSSTSLTGEVPKINFIDERTLTHIKSQTEPPSSFLEKPVDPDPNDSSMIWWKPDTTSPTVTEEKLSIELCLGCKIDGGLGYTNHPTRCDLFVICYPSNRGMMKPVSMACPYGLFWSQNALTCKRSKEVHCPHEVCQHQSDKYQYAQKGNCRAYWECQNRYSFPKCCPENMRFEDGRGCVESKDICQDECPMFNTNTKDSWIAQCDKREIPGVPGKYERHAYQTLDSNIRSHGFKEWIIQECPPGTIFQQEVCDCSRAGQDIPTYEFEGQKCAPEVYLPFTDHLRDVSPGRTHVRAENVTRRAGAACFSGYSALAMPKFANMDIGTYLFIKLRYKQSTSGDTSEAILYNGDCDMKPSLVLGTKPTGNFLSVKTTTGQLKTMWVDSTTPATDWRTVSVVIDGENVRLETDKHSNTMKIRGGITRSKCGMKIGWGEGYNHFHGCIDDFSLYRCRPDTATTVRR